MRQASIPFPSLNGNIALHYAHHAEPSWYWSQTRLYHQNAKLQPRKHHVHREFLPKPRTANKQPLHVCGMILIFVRFGYLFVSVWFGVVPDLAIDMFFSTSFIDRLIWDTVQSEPKTVLWNSHAVANLAINRRAKTDIVAWSRAYHKNQAYQTCRKVVDTYSYYTTGPFRIVHLTQCTAYNFCFRYSYH